MPAPRRFLGEQAQTVETRANAMAKPLEAWLRRLSRVVADAEIKAVEASGQFAKQLFDIDPLDRERLENQLRQILFRFGQRQLEQSIVTGAATVGAQVSIAQELVNEFLATKEIRLTGIVDSSIEMARESTRSIIQEALAEEVRPSTTEIGRRLRNRLNCGTTVDGASFAFSPERAQLIARTEMVQASNTGIVQGYQLSGVRRMKWLSYQDDRSGRGHDKMLGQIREIGRPFVAPDGTELMYPGDPNAPIRHTANCRCTVIPVVEPRQ